MAKYEIMLILAPGEKTEVASKLATDVFGKKALLKVEKLERTELAYPINKSSTATYVLMNLEADETKVSEFVRLSNILKTIWRVLVINLDSEKGLNRKVTVKKTRSKPAFKRAFNRRPEGEGRRPFDGEQRRPFDGEQRRPYVKFDKTDKSEKTQKESA